MKFSMKQSNKRKRKYILIIPRLQRKNTWKSSYLDLKIINVGIKNKYCVLF